MSRNQDPHTAQLAAQFSEFYIQTTQATSQIGTYRIIEEIGEGAFGKVYLASHVLLDVQVVLKCGLLDDPNIVREIYYHKQLKHRNIVRLYEIIKTELHLWLVLEYCEGKDLFYYIYEERRLLVETCRKLFVQVLDAIRYVHSLNLSHRDLKLENILLADKQKSVVKLTDFGFVREFNPYKRQFLSTVCGTLVYMAPELLRKEKYSGFAVDVWSLGVILFTMLYGEMPFDEDDELQTQFKIINTEPVYKDTIPADAIVLLKKMLAKDPFARPSLAEILALPFLTETLMSRQASRRSSVYTDTDSIMSVNHYYNTHPVPFQSKLERHLLKKLEKTNINVHSLQQLVADGVINSLTAFYDLMLAKEFSRKKSKYQKDRKLRYEARKSLKRSKKRVKSALLLTDQQPQPLERIILSLSLNSSRHLPEELSKLRSHDSRRVVSAPRMEVDQSPLNRTVSFFPDDVRRPSNATSSTASENLKKRSKNSRFLNSLQFWKRNKTEHQMSLDEPEGFPVPVPEVQGRRKSDASEGPLEINIKPKTPSPPPLPKVETSVATESADNTTPTSIKELGTPVSDSFYSRRTRPSSMVLQMSQLSHFSQLSTMISESEIDLDTMDDEYGYESSISEIKQPVSTPKTGKGRPGYVRGVSSDVSIMSSSTTATRHAKKPSLSQVSSNSSDESVQTSQTRNRSFTSQATPVPLPHQSNDLDLTLLPREGKKRTFIHPKLWTNNFSPRPARSASPPLSNTFNRFKLGKKDDDWQKGFTTVSPAPVTHTRRFEPNTKFNEINEEDEDEN